MFRFSKINSKQAGPFKTPQNRMIDIDLPADTVINMNESFVQLLLSIETQNPDVVNYVPRSTTEDFIPMNLDLVRNCSLRGAKTGKLEDIRRVNLLKHNMNLLSKSNEQKLSLIDSLYQQTDYYSHHLYSPFVDFNKEGGSESQYRNAALRIPLSDLFELGSTQTMDTSKTGTLTIHLELENLNNLTLEHKKLFNDPAEGALLDIDDGDSRNTLITVAQYPNLELSPFFVGQVLNLQGETSPPQDPSDVVIPPQVKITSINRNPDLTLSLGIDISLPNNSDPESFTYEGLLLTEPDEIIPATLNVLTCEIGLCEVMGAKMPTNVSNLEYTTWTTEEYSNGPQRQLNKIFEVEPEAVNAVLMMDTTTSNLISNNEGITDYRMRVDNMDVYNRDILVNKETEKEKYIHDSLHYDSIIRTFKNLGYPLKDLTLMGLKREVPIGDEGYQSRFTAANQQIMLMCCPLPLTPLNKKLQFNITAGKTELSRVENVVLYKQVIRNIKY